MFSWTCYALAPYGYAVANMHENIHQADFSKFIENFCGRLTEAFDLQGFSIKRKRESRLKYEP